MALYNFYSIDSLQALGKEIGHPKLGAAVEDLSLVANMIRDARRFAAKEGRNDDKHHVRLDAMEHRVVRRGYANFAEFWRREICGDEYYNAIEAFHTWLSRFYKGDIYNPASSTLPLRITDELSVFVGNPITDYRQQLRGAFPDTPTVQEFFRQRLWINTRPVWTDYGRPLCTIMDGVVHIHDYMDALGDMLQYSPNAEEARLVAFCMAFDERLGHDATIRKYLGGAEATLRSMIWVEYQRHSLLFRMEE
jgi:hypothetical protein